MTTPQPSDAAPVPTTRGEVWGQCPLCGDLIEDDDMREPYIDIDGNPMWMHLRCKLDVEAERRCRRHGRRAIEDRAEAGEGSRWQSDMPQNSHRTRQDGPEPQNMGIRS